MDRHYAAGEETGAGRWHCCYEVKWRQHGLDAKRLDNKRASVGYLNTTHAHAHLTCTIRADATSAVVFGEAEAVTLDPLSLLELGHIVRVHQKLHHGDVGQVWICVCMMFPPWLRVSLPSMKCLGP